MSGPSSALIPFAPTTKVWVSRGKPFRKAIYEVQFQNVGNGEEFWKEDPRTNPSAIRYRKYDDGNAEQIAPATSRTSGGGDMRNVLAIIAGFVIFAIIVGVLLGSGIVKVPVATVDLTSVNTRLDKIAEATPAPTMDVQALGDSIGKSVAANLPKPSSDPKVDAVASAQADTNTKLDDAIGRLGSIGDKLDNLPDAIASAISSAMPSPTPSPTATPSPTPSPSDSTAPSPSPSASDNGTGGGDGNSYIGSNFDPVPFYSQSCDPTRDCTYDYGTMGDHMNANLNRHVVQVGIIKGVKTAWPQGGKIDQPGRCDIVVLNPNGSFNNVVTRDANVTIYDVWEGDVAGWTRTLALQAMDEQHLNPNYNCPTKPYNEIPHWGSPIPSPPCGVEGFANCDVVTPGTGDNTTQDTSTQDSTTTDNGGGSSTSQTKPDGTLVKLTGLEDNTHGSNGMVRRLSIDAPNGALKVNKGESAEGATIQVGSKKYSQCYILKVTSSNVVVYGGTANFWNEEVLRDKLQPCAAS